MKPARIGYSGGEGRYASRFDITVYQIAECTCLLPQKKVWHVLCSYDAEHRTRMLAIRIPGELSSSSPFHSVQFMIDPIQPQIPEGVKGSPKRPVEGGCEDCWKMLVMAGKLLGAGALAVENVKPVLGPARILSSILT